MSKSALFWVIAATTIFARVASADVHYYLVDAVAKQSTHADLRAEASELERIYADMERQAGVEAKLVWSTNADVNAFATIVGDDKVVVVQQGLLAMVDTDRDEVAAVLGHELGHHKADHIRSARKKAEGAHALGAILGAVVGAKIGKGTGAVAGAAVGSVGGGLVALKFNRDQEMEADRLSVGWMIAAGYNPQGMLRLQQRLAELETHSHAEILSTHPTSQKRYQAAEQLIAKLSPPPELLQRQVVPLVGADALAAASTEIRGLEDAQVAEALGGAAPQPDAAALAPVQKINLAAYATIDNQLDATGKKNKARVFAANHVTEKQYQQAADAFEARMKTDRALTLRYMVEYFRATQGKFAVYGRELADSYEKNQPLHLEPPYAIATAVELRRAMKSRNVDDNDALQAKAETELLKPHGLSYYDYTIASSWWSRKASIAALTGDDSLVRRYVLLQSDDDDDDDEAIVASSNVHIGSNVHINGKAVTTERAAKQP